MRKLGLHLGLYALVLVAVMSFIPLDSSFSSDAGAYGGQVFALERGSWALERPLAVVAEGNEGWLNSAITPEGPTPYTANPAYPLLLQGAVRAVHGPLDDGATAGSMAFGLHLVPWIGAVASAVAAWHLAALWDRRASPLAFWILALGPVLVQATTLWAHSLSTAVGGLALLFVVRAVRASAVFSAEGNRSIIVNQLAAAPLLVAGALIRTESIFWVAALAVTALVAAWSNQSRLLAACAVGGSGVAAAVWLVSRGWGQSLRADRLPVETSVQVLADAPSWLSSRIPAAWQLLLSSLAGGPGPILTLGALGLGLLGARRLRSDEDVQSRRVGSVLIAIAAALYGLRIVLAPEVPISGVLGAWPLIAVLPLAAGRRELTLPRSLPTLGPLVTPVVVLTVAVVVTQYANSGGLQWGGRYLSFAFAPLAAAVAVKGHETFRRQPAMAALLVAPALMGVVVSHDLQDVHRQVIDATVEVEAEVVITEYVAVPRVAWTELPTAYYLADAESIEDLLDRLGLEGVDTVNVHGLRDTDVDGMGGYREIGRNDVLRHLRLGAVGEDDTVRPSPGVLASGP